MELTVLAMELTMLAMELNVVLHKAIFRIEEANLWCAQEHQQSQGYFQWKVILMAQGHQHPQFKIICIYILHFIICFIMMPHEHNKSKIDKNVKSETHEMPIPGELSVIIKDLMAASRKQLVIWPSLLSRFQRHRWLWVRLSSQLAKRLYHANSMFSTVILMAWGRTAVTPVCDWLTHGGCNIVQVQVLELELYSHTHTVLS